MSTSKKRFLEREGLLNPRAERVVHPSFVELDFFDALDLPQVRYEMLRTARGGGVPVAEACRLFGFSREYFYKLERAFLERGFIAFVGSKMGRRPLIALNQEIVNFIIHRKIEEPKLSGGRLRQEVRRCYAVECSTRTVERVVERFGLGKKTGRQHR